MDCEHVCHCDCHEGKSMHMVACCHPCGECGQNVVSNRFRQPSHEEKCHNHTKVDSK